ncbi:MAG: hypothetical protein JXA42_08025 [Anaerolineales bacterium]|nr:hypothetical protein [Anaerolineales bacterium]
MKKSISIATMLAIMLTVGVVGLVSADEGDTDGKYLWQGIILAIEDNRITLETQVDEIVVIISCDTRFRIPGIPEGDLDDLETGDRIAVTGRLDQDGSVLARLIVRIPIRSEAGMLRGELSAKGDDWLDITRPDGTPVRVLVTENTRFQIPNVQNGSLGDLAIGDPVYTAGVWNDRQELVARLIGLMPEDVQDVVRGKVTSINSPVIEVLTHQGIVTVITDEETRFRILGQENASIDDIMIDDLIVAGGVRTSSGLDAAVVKVVDEQTRRVVRQGVVITKSENSLEIETSGGQLLVLTDENTRIRIPGIEQATLDDIEVGSRILVAGLINENNSLLARMIGARAVQDG